MAGRSTSQQNGVKDIIKTIKKGKCRWASHVSHLRDNSWTIRATE